VNYFSDFFGRKVSQYIASGFWFDNDIVFQKFLNLTYLQDWSDALKWFGLTG